jgi:hypothetical protein
MKATPLVTRRVSVAEGVFVEIVLWLLPEPSRGSRHSYKYRLALVADGICVMRYDNEAGKGDHKHIGDREISYQFSDVDMLIADFHADVGAWLDENRRVQH